MATPPPSAAVVVGQQQPQDTCVRPDYADVSMSESSDSREQNDQTPLFLSLSCGTTPQVAAMATTGWTQHTDVNDPPQTQFLPLLQENSHLPAVLLDLIRASYGKICDCIEHDRIKFNVRQVKYMLKKLLQPAMEVNFQRLNAFLSDISQIPVLKEFLWRIKAVEMMVEYCSDTNWWRHALTRADGGMSFSYYYCELLQCIKLLDIRMNKSKMNIPCYTNRIRGQIRLTLELDEESVIGFLHVPDEPNVIDLDTTDMQSRCGDVIDKQASGGCSIEFKVAKIIYFATLGRINHRHNLPCTIPNYLRILPEDLTLRKFLGKGGGTTCVFEFEWLGNIFAGKVFEAQSRDPLDFERFGRSCRQEAEILSTVQHPNTVQLRGYCIDTERNTCTLLLDLMSQDLSHFLRTRTRSPPLSNLEAVNIMLQIAQGMRYLHERGVMHRDLKATNVLVELFHPDQMLENEGCVCRVKICDFGLSKIKLASSEFTTSHVGTTSWRAPEVFRDEAHDKKYTNKADVYSFAITCTEILTGEPPFKGILKKDLYRCITAEKGMRPPLPCSCPGYLAAYLQKCWATKPKDRPPFSEICRMLRHLKGLLIRAGSDDNFLFSSLSEIDLEEIAKHLGVKWCINEISKCGKNDIVELFYEASRSKVFASNPEFKKKLVEVGDDFVNWRGTEHEYTLAFRMFSIGGKLDCARAKWKLGLLNELGLGCFKDKRRAVKFYHEDKTANASVELGRCFKMGIASIHFMKAIDHQNKSGKAIRCVVELIDIVANGSDETLCDIACKRLYDLATRAYAVDSCFMILAGPKDINIKALIDALANPKALDNSKYMITKMLHELLRREKYFIREAGAKLFEHMWNIEYAPVLGGYVGSLLVSIMGINMVLKNRPDWYMISNTRV